MTEKRMMSEHLIQIPALNGGDADGQAEEWLAYLYSGEASDQGRQQFSAWLGQSQENEVAYTRVERLWRDMPGFIGESKVVAECSLSKKSTPSKKEEDKVVTLHARKSFFDRFTKPVAIAAGLLLVIGVAFTQLYDPVTPVSYASAVGEVKTFELSDGSQVTLSASSAIVVRFSKEQRQIELTRGGAYFDVAGDLERVFSVEIAATKIRVVGTEFDIRKNADDVRIAVAEGMIDVTSATKTAVSGVSSRQQRLSAGQQIFASLGGDMSEVQHFDTRDAFAWREGRLVYVDTRLEDVLAEVNRYRAAKIVLGEESLGDIRVTTAFRADQTDQLLSGLAATQPVEISRLPAGVLIKAK